MDTLIMGVWLLLLIALAFYYACIDAPKNRLLQDKIMQDIYANRIALLVQELKDKKGK
jgi:hypothetical protein